MAITRKLAPPPPPLPLHPLSRRGKTLSGLNRGDRVTVQYEAVVIGTPGQRGMLRVHRNGSLHYDLVPVSCVRKLP